MHFTVRLDSQQEEMTMERHCTRNTPSKSAVPGLQAVAGALALALSGAAFAQADAAKDFPNRPLRIIVPFTSGSGSDSSARFYGEALGRVLGQPVVVENRPGANGVIGIQALKSAPADGYTILLASNSPLSVNPIVLKNLPYDPLADLRPVAGLSRNMNVFLVPVDSPWKTLADVVAAGKTGVEYLEQAYGFIEVAVGGVGVGGFVFGRYMEVAELAEHRANVRGLEGQPL
jgi:hypothetical protein